MTEAQKKARTYAEQTPAPNGQNCVNSTDTISYIKPEKWNELGEQAAKESAEKCQIKYGRDFTQAVDMFKRGAEWQSQHCVTDCVKEADTKALEERAAEEAAVEQNILEAEKCCESCKHSAMSDVARTAIVRGFRKGREYQSQQLPPAPEEWAKVRDEQYSHFEQSGSVLQKTVGTGYLLGFDAALDLIARPLLKRCEELEALLAEAKGQGGNE